MKEEKSSIQLVHDPSSKSSLINPSLLLTPSTPKKKEDYIHPPKPSTLQQRGVQSARHHMISISKEKKWLLAFIITIFALLFFSTFTVSILDRFCYQRGIDLFNPDQKQNEITLNILQFILFFLLVRFLFRYL